MRLIDADMLAFYVRQHWEELYPKDGAMIDAILVAKTVEVEPVRHGHWKESGTCSVCGKKAIKKIIFDDEMLWEDEYDYCPHCGAKMDKVIK